MRVIRGASDQGLLGLDLEAFTPQDVQHANRFAQDLGADAVAG
jgi:hypothetical protein